MRQLKIQQSITNREEASTEKYLYDISKFSLISHEEETILAQQIRGGGPEGEKARDKLVNANLRFVVSVAKQYQRLGLSIGDLINEGNLGLMKAASRFDETKGFKFISYAVWRIRQSILQAISDSGNMVRLPSNKETSRRSLEKFSDTFMQQYEREPTAEELAEISGTPIEEVSMLLRPKKHASLDSPIGQDEGGDVTFGDMIAGSEENAVDALLMDDTRRGVIRALHSLSPREKDAIAVFFGLGEEIKKELHITLSSKDEFCDMYKVTSEQAKNIKNRVLQKLAVKSKNTSTTFGEITQDKKHKIDWKSLYKYNPDKKYVKEIESKLNTKEKSSKETSHMTAPVVRDTSAEDSHQTPVATRDTTSTQGVSPDQPINDKTTYTETQTSPTHEIMMVLSPAQGSTILVRDRERLKKITKDSHLLQDISAKNQGNKAMTMLLPELMIFLATQGELHEGLYDEFYKYLVQGKSAMIIGHAQLQKFLKDIAEEGANV